MKQCKKCGNSIGNGAFCSRCGAKLDENNSVEVENRPSIFLKYAEFMDDDLLYKTAVSKLNGLLGGGKEEAIEIFKLLAFRGHADSMYRYAESCLEQNPPDRETAYHWLRVAADMGHTPSQLLIAKEKGEMPKLRNERLQMRGGDESFESLVSDSLPAIVMITASKRQGNRRSVSAGSGFIVEGGYVVTNAHVVGSDPDSVVGNFEPSIDDKSYNLLPLLIDPKLDVAILKFTGMAATKVSSRRQLEFRVKGVGYGEKVYTIGNPLGIGVSVSQGIVSCPDRGTNYPQNVKTVIQTDITLNHGNSGGALMDTANNVIGMVTFMPGNSEGGIGMCVPAEYIVGALNRVRE